MIYLNEEEVRIAIAYYCGVPEAKVQLMYTYNTDGTCYVEAEVEESK